MKKVLLDQSKKTQDFELEIVKFINIENIGQNITISPLSIFHILSLTTNGAANLTMVEMLKLLGYKNKIELNKINLQISQTISKLKTVEMANAIFTKFKPEKDFIKYTEQYKSKIDNLISKEQVNKWCSNATNKKINEIIDDINGVLMILINAIYFKGNWQKKFDVNLTSEGKFYNFNKDEKITDFMNKTDNFFYLENQNEQVIQLDYEKDKLTALIILPKIEKDINTYIKNFTLKKYNEVLKSLRKKKVVLSLPKFEIKYETELKNILISMGMKEAFGKADFSIMKKEKDIHLSRVIHKTFIKVDEQGTEAAAVTAVVMRKMCVIRDEEPSVMVINKPFLFIVRNDNLPDGFDILFFSKVEAL